MPNDALVIGNYNSMQIEISLISQFIIFVKSKTLTSVSTRMSTLIVYIIVEKELETIEEKLGD